LKTIEKTADYNNYRKRKSYKNARGQKIEYYDCTTVSNCPVKKYITFETNRTKNISYNNEIHNHSPPGIIFIYICINISSNK